MKTKITAEELAELSAAATPGEWDAECYEGEGEVEINAGSARTRWNEEGTAGIPARSWRTSDRILEKDDLWDEEFEQVAADAEFIVALVNAYRSGSLVWAGKEKG